MENENSFSSFHCFRKTKRTKFSVFLRTCAYQGVRNVHLSENWACFVFLKHPFWDSPFCLITDFLWHSWDTDTRWSQFQTNIFLTNNLLLRGGKTKTNFFESILCSQLIWLHLYYYHLEQLIYFTYFQKIKY